MLIVARCESCGGGNVGLLTCGGCETVFAMCDECDALWTKHPSQAEPGFPIQPSIPCPVCQASLHHAHWSTRHEVSSTDWEQQVIDDGPAISDGKS